jgi:hypothetical protein
VKAAIFGLALLIQRKIGGAITPLTTGAKNPADLTRTNQGPIFATE